MDGRNGVAADGPDPHHRRGRYAEQLSSGIVYAADRGAQVINISEGAVYPGGCSSNVQAAVVHAIEKGRWLASMENEGNASNGVLFPGSCVGVPEVGASSGVGSAAAVMAFVLLAALGIIVAAIAIAVRRGGVGQWTAARVTRRSGRTS
ncbi:hypothetical protein [Kribbella pittospori]|uniref:hypothetical protein n=1 Tax=Kribbella pittospori TaxID=722689 RepID=UPI001EDF448A|nr:hypothetical protein [Kribbella pittospori]